MQTYQVTGMESVGLADAFNLPNDPDMDNPNVVYLCEEHFRDAVRWLGYRHKNFPKAPSLTQWPCDVCVHEKRVKDLPAIAKNAARHLDVCGVKAICAVYGDLDERMKKIEDAIAAYSEAENVKEP